MKILSTAYTQAHGIRALQHLSKAVICNRIMPSDVHKMYNALIHLERYKERLTKRKPVGEYSLKKC